MSDNLLVPGRSRSPVPRLRIPLPTLPNATSEATLRSSLTPEHIRSTIRVPSARNLYEIMHAGDGLPVYQSTPDLFTHRPKTSSISSFTARENLRLEQRLNVGAVGPKRYVDGSSTVRVIGTVPGEEDFRRVIDKLTRITARGGAQDKRLSIEEGRTVTASAEEGETVFGKVNVKNCRTPMVLTVKRSRGKLLIYVSKTVPEPMENLCDARFKGDRVMVTDTGLRFKCTTVFVTFTALEITDFTVTVQFGKQKRITRSTLRETDGFERTSDISMLGLLRDKKTSKKDFVSINMRVCASVDRLQTMAERRSQSEKRRKEAIFRYHEHLAQKKESALLMLKRQEIKKQHRMEMQLIHEAKMVEKEKEKGLVTLVTNAVLLESMVGRLQSKKAQIAEEENRHKLVARVQHMIRKFLLHRTPHMIAISLCTHHFAIMLHTLLPADISRIQKNIMLCLRISFQRTKVTTQFGKFYEGGKRANSVDIAAGVENRYFHEEKPL